MTNKQIFKKAILKAEKNGFNVLKHLPAFPPKGFFEKEKSFTFLYVIKEKILFSHDFAETFWGKEWYVEEFPEQSNKGYYSSTMDTNDVMFQGMPYTYHLQQMILEKEPLRYIKKFLKVERSKGKK